MLDRCMRLKNITIENFKNVQHGTLDFENNRKSYHFSMLGLYGQNGSGKTALINAIALLKDIISGNSISEEYSDYINIAGKEAHIKYTFIITEGDMRYEIIYEVSLLKIIREAYPINNISTTITSKPKIISELLSYSFSSELEKSKMSKLIDTDTSDPFLPKTKYNELIGRNKNKRLNMLVIKRLAEMASTSYIFSKGFLSSIFENCKNEKHIFVIKSLLEFGTENLFVFNIKNTGMINLDSLPLSMIFKKNDIGAIGQYIFPLTKATTLPEKVYHVFNTAIQNLDIVLREIVPGLEIKLKIFGKELSESGENGVRVQLVSIRNGKELPFYCESDGIRKIVAILQLLIVVYNNPSVTVAVDELDAGIFEYLLGEILRILADGGKGQLIFTSHNLRPLETVDRGFIAFTSTNPQNRYVRMSNVKETNNLRDFYYRDILLGGQTEELYNKTNNFDIAFAFREAGEACEF